jgi:hypothetical protein
LEGWIVNRRIFSSIHPPWRIPEYTVRVDQLNATKHFQSARQSKSLPPKIGRNGILNCGSRFLEPNLFTPFLKPLSLAFGFLLLNTPLYSDDSSISGTTPTAGLLDKKPDHRVQVKAAQRPPQWRDSLEISLVISPMGFLSYSQYEAGVQVRFLNRPFSLGLEYLSVPGNVQKIYLDDTGQGYGPYPMVVQEGSPAPNNNGFAFNLKYLLRSGLGEFSLGPLIGFDWGQIVVQYPSNWKFSEDPAASTDDIDYFLMGAELGYRIPIWQGLFLDAGARVLWQTDVYQNPYSTGEGLFGGQSQSPGFGTNVSDYRVYTGFLQLGYGFNL